MPVIDLNLPPKLRYLSAIIFRQEESANVHGQACLLSTYGSSTPIHFQALRTTLPRRPVYQAVPVHGSVSLHGLCATDLPRKPPRYRDLPSSSQKQIAPHGHSEAHTLKNERRFQCQRKLVRKRAMRFPPNNQLLLFRP
jgi:hypothetical protein